MSIHGKLFFYLGVALFIGGVILRFLDLIMFGVILNFVGVAFAFLGLLIRD